MTVEVAAELSALWLDDGRKFWWGDWTKMLGDAITAVRTGEPVLYPDDDEPE